MTPVNEFFQAWYRMLRRGMPIATQALMINHKEFTPRGSVVPFAPGEQFKLLTEGTECMWVEHIQTGVRCIVSKEVFQ